MPIVINLIIQLLIVSFITPSCATKQGRPIVLSSGKSGHIYRCDGAMNDCQKDIKSMCRGSYKIHHYLVSPFTETEKVLKQKHLENLGMLVECLDGEWSQANCDQEGVRCFK